MVWFVDAKYYQQQEKKRTKTVVENKKKNSRRKRESIKNGARRMKQSKFNESCAHTHTHNLCNFHSTSFKLHLVSTHNIVSTLWHAYTKCMVSKWFYMFLWLTGWLAGCCYCCVASIKIQSSSVCLCVRACVCTFRVWYVWRGKRRQLENRPGQQYRRNIQIVSYLMRTRWSLIHIHSERERERRI